MKRIISLVLGGFTCVHAAVAVDSVYQNFGLVTNSPVVDAVGFDNRGTIELLSPLSGGYWGSTYTVFDTQNTRYFTNRGTMVGSLGFNFENLIPSPLTHRPAALFTNTGNIVGLDSPYGSIYNYNILGVPIASQVSVLASNIYNPGSISVGDLGVLRLSGKTVDLRNGALSAGGSSTGLTNQYGFLSTYGYRLYGTNEYSNPSGVQDLLAEINTTYLSLAGLTYGGTGGWSPIWNDPYYFNNGTGSYGAWAYVLSPSLTNFYIDIVFVRTNDLSTNISLDVRFASGGETYPFNTNRIANGILNMVRLGSVGTDVITGQVVTNSYYVLDSGGVEANYTMLTNITAGTMSPSCIEIDTESPYISWDRLAQSNFPYTSDLIYPGYDFSVVTNTYASYMAQVGLGGATAQFLNTSTNVSFAYVNPNINLDDITNQGARVEINAGNLKLDNTRLRTEGLLTLNAKHLTVGSKVAIDSGVINCDLGSTNGSLMISNVLPSAFSRIRGNIYCWSSTWTNSSTTGAATNYFTVHVTIVDPNITAGAAPDVRNLALRATNVLVVDPLNVSSSALFDTKNLAFNGPVNLTSDAGSFIGSTAPKLANLLVDTNSAVVVANQIALGVDADNGLATITNRGSIVGSEFNAKAAVFEHSGFIYSSNSLFIEVTSGALKTNVNAGTLTLTTNLVPKLDVAPGTQITNQVPVPSRLYSAWDIELSARVLEANFCMITNGIASSGSLVLNVSDRLSDEVPPVAGTNGIMKNAWQVKNGFHLVRKPASGDLYGTTIRTIADQFQYVSHTWAAADRGATAAGFVDNAVIGHLILERKTAGSWMAFSGSTDKSAMYVDRLDFEGYAYTNYADGLYISPNMVVYFADSNVDPGKLMTSYPGRLVWVPEFAGPNSSAAILAHVNGMVTNVFANRSLAQDKEIDSNGNGVPNYYDTFPFDGTFLAATINGAGTLSPNLNGKALTIGGNYTMSAIPGRGYIFTNWSVTSDAGTVLSSSPNLAFKMRSNLKVQANFVPDPAYVVVTVNGPGQVTPDMSASSLVFGRSYQLRAIAQPGAVFTGWTGDLTPKTPNVTFTMKPNLHLQANFVTNQLVGLKGSYSGLFYEVDAGVTNITFDNSGAFSFILSDNGTAPGKLTMASGVYSFNAKFNWDGTAQVVVSRGALPAVTFNITLAPSNGGTLTGFISGPGWLSEAHGYRAVFNAATNPAPMAGYYTFALPGATDGNGPAGDSYGTVTVSRAGAVTASGKLADGTAFTQSGTVSQTGQWAFYVFRSGKDALVSMINFDTNNGSVSSMADNQFIGLSGTMFWNKKAGATALYKTGFSYQTEIAGSWYTPVQKGTGLVLSDPVLLQLTGGNLDQVWIRTVALNSGSSTYVSVQNDATLVISPKTGLFTGRVVNSAGKATVFNGVVLPRQDVARGCFYGVSQSGEVLLESY